MMNLYDALNLIYCVYSADDIMDWRDISRSRSRMSVDWRPNSHSRSRPPPIARSFDYNQMQGKPLSEQKEKFHSTFTPNQFSHLYETTLKHDHRAAQHPIQVNNSHDERPPSRENNHGRRSSIGLPFKTEDDGETCLF